jgi:hypothetical protein
MGELENGNLSLDDVDRACDALNAIDDAAIRMRKKRKGRKG